MKRKNEEPFGFQTIVKGGFRNNGFAIHTIIIHLNDPAMTEWYLLQLQPYLATSKEREEYKVKSRKKRKAWDRKILDALGFAASTNYYITQSSSEIFTVIIYEPEN